MIIYVDGPRRSGRTTLAQVLAATYGMTYLPSTTCVGDDPRYHLDALAGLDGHAVLDGGFLTEVAYGPVMFQRCRLDPTKLLTLLRLCQRQRVLMVHASQSPPVLMARHADRTEGTQALQAQVLFDLAYRQAGRFVPVLTFHGDHGRFLRSHHELFVTERNRDIRRVDLSGVGSTTPVMILMGDQVNPKTTWAGLPFDGGPAAAYLHEALQQTGIPPTHLHLLNAKRPTGKPTSLLEVACLRSGFPLLKLVALGEAAAEWFEAHGQKHVKLEHPQFRRRFKPGKLAEYVQQIRKAYEAV